MGRRRLDLSQGDIQRALKAFTKAGIPVSHCEVEGRKLIIWVKEDGGTVQRKIINPLDNSPPFWGKKKGPK